MYQIFSASREIYLEIHAPFFLSNAVTFDMKNNDNMGNCRGNVQFLFIIEGSWIM